MSEPIADTPAADPNEPAAISDFAAFEATENRKALGEPEPEIVAPTSAADAAEKDEDEGETAPAAVGQPAARVAPTPEKPISKRQQQINDLIRRSTEADLRAKALEAEIQALKAGKPAAEPEKKVEVATVVDAGDPEPQEAQFESYAAFIKAMARWEVRQAKREADAETAKFQREHAELAQRTEFETKAKDWIGRRDSFAAAHPDKAERLLTFLDHVHPGTPIGDVILESEVGAEVADYLAANQPEAERIARLAPISALRALGKIEAKFDPESVTSASASAGPAARTVTQAPAPPMTLAARSAEPADRAKAALERGDYAAWEAEENRKALAASR